MLSDEKKIVIDEDIQFIYDTQPKGGISFKEDFYITAWGWVSNMYSCNRHANNYVGILVTRNNEFRKFYRNG